MPDKESVIKIKDIDDELYLLVERDFPMLQKDVEEIKKTVKLIEKSSENDRAATKEVSSQLVRVTEDVKSVTADVKSVAEDLKSLAISVSTIQKGPHVEKPELPWWQDFRNILILLLVAGFMTLAGVKAAESLFLKVNPTSLIDQTPQQQEENL